MAATIEQDQEPTIKTRTYTFALTVENTPNITEIVKLVELFPKWSWIIHDKDRQPDGTPKKNHYHFYVDFPNPRSLKSLAKELKIAPNFIQKVYSKKAILSYLTHSNQPEKYQYDISEVHSNFVFADEIKDDDIDVLQMYRDYKNVKAGIMTPEEYLARYLLRRSMSVFSYMRAFEMLVAYDPYFAYFRAKGDSRNVSLSTFRVPCSNNAYSNLNQQNSGTKSENNNSEASML